MKVDFDETVLLDESGFDEQVFFAVGTDRVKSTSFRLTMMVRLLPIRRSALEDQDLSDMLEYAAPSNRLGTTTVSSDNRSQWSVLRWG